jgi:hypothetical protein
MPSACVWCESSHRGVDRVTIEAANLSGWCLGCAFRFDFQERQQLFAEILCIARATWTLVALVVRLDA